MSKPAIAILGAGNMASALAIHLARHKRPVRMYCIERDVEEEIRRHSSNKKYLAGYRFPKNVTATNDIAAALADTEDVFIAVPSIAAIEVVSKSLPFLTNKIRCIANVSKGLDSKTLEPIVLTEANMLPPALRKRLCMLGGPVIATEMAAGSPSGFIVAGTDRATIKHVRDLLETEKVTCASSNDLRGVGLASALKNAYAIALGFCDGLKYSTNTKAMLLAIAVNEMGLLIQKAGGHAETATGLAGLGDLFVTGMSPHGHNRRYGEKLVGAKSKNPITLGLKTVEGIAATMIANKLARTYKLKTPLLDAIDRCLARRNNYERPFVDYLKHLQLP